MRRFRIGERWVGAGEPCYVIAELSGNHNGKLERALALVRAAKEAGADAVKTQTYRADTLTIDSDRPEFRIGAGTPWAGRTLYELYEEAHTPWEWMSALQACARYQGIEFFSSPFDASAVELLEGLEVPAYKIASFENVDLELLRLVGRTGKPIIVSGGLASAEELAEAVATVRAAGSPAVAVMKCTSAYPAPPDDLNLRTIPHLRETLDVVVGLSDHTLGTTAAVAAVAQGASIVEKHFTLRRADGGPDAAFSLEPEEFRTMVTAIREAERMLGRINYDRSPSEEKSVVFRRSLFAVKDIAEGEPLTRENVRSIRPGNGLAPRDLDVVLRRRAARRILRGEPITWDAVGGPPPK